MILEDWEYESQKDSIFLAERNNDIMMSWWKEESVQPANITIKTIKNANKSKPIRRTYKKIVLFRSHLPIKVNREVI